MAKTNAEIKQIRDDFAASKAKVAANREKEFLKDQDAGSWKPNAPEHIVNYDDGWSLIPRAATAP